MNDTKTGVVADTGNLDDILGSAPVAEPLEEEAIEKESEKPSKQKEEKQKEEKPQEKEDKAEEEPREKKFSHGALHEERERRKEAQRLAKDEKERNDRLEERQNRIMEALAGRTAAAAQEQEYVDPLARLENEVREVKETLTKSQIQINDDQKKFIEEQRLVNRYKGSIEAFAKDAPDFGDARNYLIADRVKELQLLNYNEVEINDEIKRIEKQIVERAYNLEQNPAEIIYKLAREKGYQHKEAEKTIENIDKGLKASKSLGSGGSVSNDGDWTKMSAADLAEMSTEEFNALFSKIEKQSKRRA